MTKPTKWHVRPAKTQISLAVRLKKAWVLSYPLSAEESLCDQTERMPRLIWVFTGRTVILLVLSCGGSFLHYDNTHLLVFVKIYGTFFISVVYSNIQGSQKMIYKWRKVHLISWNLPDDFALSIFFYTELLPKWVSRNVTQNRFIYLFITRWLQTQSRRQC